MTSLVSAPLSGTSPRFAFNVRPLAGAAFLLLAGTFYLIETVSIRQGALWMIGALLGITLYHSAFGFTHAWRVFIADRRGDGLRAQMLMLALGVILFFPFLAQGTLAGQTVSGFVAPPGLSIVLGAFLFGIGMQIGGGCASGTLFSAGGGSTRMFITLFFFIVGSVLAALNYSWWSTLPAIAPISMVKSWGLWPALVVNLTVFALIAFVSVVLEKRRHGVLISRKTGNLKAASLIRGPWTLVWGAVALVVLNFATLALAGRPWGITGAFTIWGSKALMAIDVHDPTQWTFWMRDLMPLITPLREDITSVMNIGLILGAMGAAAVAGKFAPIWKIPPRIVLASVIGGIMLGYGARLAFGCNIGAYFSGILSGSVHAWLWLPAAFAGNVIGVRLRPLFGLQIEKSTTISRC